ncbi:THAP domain-containing protein 1 B-like [Stegodyphus dumicola]|uniref:THAP domain-containing protein 1 B-like n=1 Tax=Stegodyphus dumicola TaxID=202533 RepID=UPI0015ABBE71|nr:THAP domain-containing protein 1 B-like [Stegodyphus dumicola]
MVFKCCVPLCKGNYNGGPRVHVFSFPRDPELKKKWIYSIKRDNFEPTKNSKVCELHFSPCDIEKETYMHLEETGETLSAPLKIPRLRKDAVPTKLPGAPSYLSTDVSIRESVKERQTIRENRQLQMAISKSIMSKKSEDSKSVFTTFSELQQFYSKIYCCHEIKYNCYWNF